MGGCQNYGPFLGVHVKGDVDIDVDIDTDSIWNLYSRLQKVGIWIWDDLGWSSFFSRIWGRGEVIFQLSGFYCNGAPFWESMAKGM